MSLGSSANPLATSTTSASKGYRQGTSTGSAQLLSALSGVGGLPTGATKALIVPTATVRFRDDGTAPTSSVGLPVTAGQPYTYDGDQLAALQVIGSATLDIQFFT